MRSDPFVVFAGVNGSTFVGVDAVTKPTLLGGKGNPQQGRVTKILRDASVMVFQNKRSNAYENMVRRRLALEGKEPFDWELGPRSWGTRIPETPIIEHEKDGVLFYYLEVIFLKPGKTTLLLDNNLVHRDDILGLKDHTDTDPDSQGGLDNKVVIR